MTAHISDDGLREQTVFEHNDNTGCYASQFLCDIGLAKTGLFIGKLHDVGKSKQAFQDYIRFGGVRGSVIHTFIPVKYLLDNFHGASNSDCDALFRTISVELLAYACGAHHGLFDCADSFDEHGFSHRVEQSDMGYDEVVGNMARDGLTNDVVSNMLDDAVSELMPVLRKLYQFAAKSQGDALSEFYFYCGLLARLLTSAVIDADRRDTAEFMSGISYPSRMSDGDLMSLWQSCLASLDEYVVAKSDGSVLSSVRQSISNSCRDSALRASDSDVVFRFYAPCGAGKTLSSAVFALQRAMSGSDLKRRLIFTAPRLSIINQNVEVIKAAFGKPDIVLECDSDVVNDRDISGEDYKENYKQLSETWDSPVVVTTAVQLLNALFDDSVSSVRRFHSLCNSVIVIDEIQSIPTKMLSMFSLAMNFLSIVCRTTVVVCSATLPCLSELSHGIQVDIQDLCPKQLSEHAIFKRVKIQYDGDAYLRDIAHRVVSCISDARSVLVVCNKRAQSRVLYKQLKHKADAVYHLSADMCHAHRDDVLAALMRDLADSSKTVICISTQVIEAGVDVSFGSVVRFLAGLDSIIQAAGRCNRNGELGPGKLGIVHVVQCLDEDLRYLPDIWRCQLAMRGFLTVYQANPALFDNCMDSDKSVQEYYRQLYRNLPVEQFDYVCKLDSHHITLFDLLSCNQAFHKVKQSDIYFMNQAFKTAGSLFQVFSDSTVSVIVPYGHGADLIADLSSERASHDMAFLYKKLREAKPYTVSLFDSQIKALGQYIVPLAGNAFGLVGHYDLDTGFDMDVDDAVCFV